MSSGERERVLGKKRESAGSLSGRKVFESKKEKKKRRLILSDSESDDDKFVVSLQNKALATERVDEIKAEAKSDLGSEAVKQAEQALVVSEVHQNGVNSQSKEKSSIHASKALEAENVDEINAEANNDLGSEVVKQAEEALAVSEVHQNGDNTTSNEVVMVESEKVSGSEVAEEREKGSVHEPTGKEEIKVESNRGSSSEVVKMEEDTNEKIESSLPIKEENSFDRLTSKEMEEESETVSRAEVDEKQEEADRVKKATNDSGASQNGSGSMINKKNSLDCLSSKEVRIDRKKVLKSKIVKQRVEDDGEKIENTVPIKEKNSINQSASKEMEVESETVSEVVGKREEADGIKKATDVFGASRNGSGSMIKKKNSLDCLRCEVDVKIDTKKVVRSKVVKQREETDSKKKSSAFAQDDQNGSSVTKKKNKVDQLSIKEEMNMEERRVLKSKVVKEREEAGSNKKSSAPSGADWKGSDSSSQKNNNNDLLPSKEEKKVESEKVLKSKVVKEREETGSNNKSSAFSGADQKGGDSYSRKNSNSDRLTSEEEKKVESKKVLKSKVVKEREEADSGKKKTAESGSERKRRRETFEDEISSKKFRTEHVKHRQEQIMETGDKNMKRNFLKSGDKGCDTKANLGSKSVASGNKQGDEANDKTMQEDLKKKNEPKTESCRWIERSTARTLRKLKDNRTSSGCARRDFVDISQQKGMGVHDKCGVLRVMPSNKKVGGIEGGHIQREEKENRKSTSNHSSPSKERKAEKPISIIKSVKDQSNLGKVSSGYSARPGKAKTEAETSSPKLKLKKGDSSNAKTDPIDKRETRSKPELSVMTELNTKNQASEPRSIVKQRVRDQIKGILLDAGWKIDLRPRRGRSYEDAVYVPPTGGAGFWSITKAYNVYVKNNTLSENSSKKSTGGDQGHEETNPKFATVPAGLLQMLTRKVVKKRRSSKESEKAKKLGVRKKGKGRKGSKNGGRILGKDDKEGGKVRKKRNTDVDVICSAAHKLHLRVRNKKKRGCALLVRGANQDTDTDDDDYVPYVWKRTILSWMIDLGILSVDGKVKYMNKKQTRALLEGSITRDGIRCGCCSKIISISKFEIHAGSKLHQPYQNIFVEEAGLSLLQCQLNAWEKQQEFQRQGFYKVDIEGDDPNDDTCGICGDGGDLICCDGCPSTFHLNCLGIQMLPPGDWHCTNCSCRYCGLVSDAVPKENGSAISTLFACSQCEKKYHRDCIPEADATSVCSNDSDTSFCGKSCKKVFRRLQKLLGTKNDLEAGLSWCLIRRFGEDSSRHPCSLPEKTECNSKVAVAFAVMDECFRPIVDHRSGINLIHNVVYNCGSNINRLSYAGFYTFVLERGDEIIAVASVRIHGTRLAEMPFIGTRNMYRRQGMCRHLLNGIEAALYSLNVEKLVIPAISELTETWINIFGFKPLDLSHRQESSSINMLVFPGTGLLHKPIVKKGSTEEHAISDGGGLDESVTEHEHMSEAANKYSMLSPERPQPCGSGEEVVHPKHNERGAELILQTTENSHAPISEPLTFQYKSSENAADPDLSVRPMVDQNELMGEDTFHINSSNEPKIEIPCEGTVHGNLEADNVASAVASGNHAVDDTAVGHAAVTKHQHFLDAENESSTPSVGHDIHGADEVVAQPKYKARDGDVTDTSTLRAVDACLERHATEDGYTPQGANLLANSDDSLQHNCAVHCNSQDLQDCNASSLHVPICSQNCNSDATHLHHSESTSKSSSSSGVELDLMVAHEHNDNTHDGRNKSTIYEPKLKSFGDNLSHDNSDTIAEPVDSTERKNPTLFIESNLYADGSDGDGTSIVHNVKAELCSEHQGI